MPANTSTLLWLSPRAIILLCCLGTAACRAQADTSGFPEARYRELLEEVRFEPPVEEDEPAATAWEIGDIDLPEPIAYAILGLLLLPLAYLVYRILNDIDLRRRTREEEDPGLIQIEDIEEEALVASGVSLSLQERAEKAGRFDVAVRLLYIQLLKDLQDGRLIRYRRDYSNRDYRRQLRNSDLLTDFHAVTIDYERYWFGKYPIDPLSYRLVKRKFSALTSRLNLAEQIDQADV